jgi:hypothetical protein
VTERHEIELLWFNGCPNHPAARELLADVVAELAPDSGFRDIDVTDPDAADKLRFPGSPTIRIDGRDVQPGFEDPGDYTPRCRLYWTDDGPSRIPPRAWIEAALRLVLAQEHGPPPQPEGSRRIA